MVLPRIEGQGAKSLITARGTDAEPKRPAAGGRRGARLCRHAETECGPWASPKSTPWDHPGSGKGVLGDVFVPAGRRCPPTAGFVTEG